MSQAYHIEGIDELVKTLTSLQEMNASAVIMDNLVEMRNRSLRAGSAASTPVSKGKHAGTLRNSVEIGRQGNGGYMLYSVHYAPHVEYGHRTRSGSYVKGRHFLKANIDTQQPLLLQQLKELSDEKMKGR